MPKLNREDWIDLARKLDWDYSYVREEDVFPEILSGRPWLPHADWQQWDEPYRTSYAKGPWILVKDIKISIAAFWPRLGNPSGIRLS